MCKRGGAEAKAVGQDRDEGELGAGVSRIRTTNRGGFGVSVPRAASDNDGQQLAGGGGEHQEGAEKLGTVGLGTWQGGGGPKSITEFLHCRDTASPPLWGGDVGPDEKYGVVPGRLSGQGSNNIDGETASPWEGWAVVLPVPGGDDERGRYHADSDIDATRG